VRNKGVLPLEEVKEEVTRLAIQQKKAELFMEEFKKAGTAAKTIDALAAVLHLEVKSQDGLNGENAAIQGLGNDNGIAGTVLGSKAGVMSKPLITENGVAVVIVNSVAPGNTNTDLLAEKTVLEQTLGSRSDYEVFNALKELSAIEDHKSRID
jgi:peptidyl-prolyl cis-trans isomerase D